MAFELIMINKGNHGSGVGKADLSIGKRGNISISAKFVKDKLGYDNPKAVYMAAMLDRETDRVAFTFNDKLTYTHYKLSVPDGTRHRYRGVAKTMIESLRPYVGIGYYDLELVEDGYNIWAPVIHEGENYGV